MRIFNHKTLAVAIASIGAIGTANAAGLDRSGQDVTAFLQDGTYAEAVYTYVDADITGTDTAGRAINDVAEPYDFFRFGVKADINDRFSVGVLYDEPFGAAVKFEGDSNFIGADSSDTITALTGEKYTNRFMGQRELIWLATGLGTIQQLAPQAAAAAASGDLATAQTLQARISRETAEVLRLSGKNTLEEAAEYTRQLGAAVNAATAADAKEGESTNVEIRTNNVTMLMGAKFGENRNFHIYGGPALQRLNGEVHLRGVAYDRMTGYDAKISTDQSVGWVAGVAYSKPEIALKAALTYRSDIEHDTTIAEIIPALGVDLTTRVDNTRSTKPFSVTLPESWNLDFQTGINPTTLLTAKVRYVPWSDFDIRPTKYTETTKLPIISYAKDQWSAEVGLGKKLSDKLSVSGNVGYDSGAGNPASTLGPIDGYYSVGLGAKYNVTPEWSVSLGGKYLKFGDAEAQLPTKAIVGNFKDNDGFIAGLKVAYQAK